MIRSLAQTNTAQRDGADGYDMARRLREVAGSPCCSSMYVCLLFIYVLRAVWGVKKWFGYKAHVAKEGREECDKAGRERKAALPVVNLDLPHG